MTAKALHRDLVETAWDYGALVGGPPTEDFTDRIIAAVLSRHPTAWQRFWAWVMPEEDEETKIDRMSW